MCADDVMSDHVRIIGCKIVLDFMHLQRMLNIKEVALPLLHSIYMVLYEEN